MYLSTAEAICIYCAGIVIISLSLCLLSFTFSFVKDMFKAK